MRHSRTITLIISASCVFMCAHSLLLFHYMPIARVMCLRKWDASVGLGFKITIWSRKKIGNLLSALFVSAMILVHCPFELHEFINYMHLWILIYFELTICFSLPLLFSPKQFCSPRKWSRFLWLIGQILFFPLCLRIFVWNCYLISNSLVVRSAETIVVCIDAQREG